MSPLSLDDLEQVYDRLAEAIDAAPEDRRERLLVKLALLLARELGDRACIERQIEAALRDL
jgi:hypothetical protein